MVIWPLVVKVAAVMKRLLNPYCRVRDLGFHDALAPTGWLIPGVRGSDHEPSITLATSPRHSPHLPTSSKSPPLRVPVKLAMVVSRRHRPHQTLDSSR